MGGIYRKRVLFLALGAFPDPPSALNNSHRFLRIDAAARRVRRETVQVASEHTDRMMVMDLAVKHGTDVAKRRTGSIYSEMLPAS